MFIDLMFMEVSIIIPAMNEEKRVGKNLDSIYRLIKFPFELILVSNGSDDNTVPILESYAKKKDNLRILEYKKRLGKGGAIMKGLQVAQGDVIGFLDADDAFNINHINNLIMEILNKRADCVIASKWKGERFSRVTEPFSRKVMGRVWNLLVRYLLGLKFHDTQAGAKFMSRKVYSSIKDDIKLTGFEFDVDLLLQVKKRKFKIVEKFIPNKYEKGSKFSLKYIPEMVGGLVKLRLSK